MADITTPTTARKTEEFTQTQIDLVRASLRIYTDFPYQPDKTYIIFDADVGDNDLHIISGSSNTYSINNGDATQPTEYTDTGGTKVLNYTTAGRYLITIDGTFNGISTSGESAANKNKYIEIVGGSNYPVNIAANAFEDCLYLESVIFKNTTSIGNRSFDTCSKLNNIYFPEVTTIGDYSFTNCDQLVNIEFKVVTTIGDYSFSQSSLLVNAIMPLLTSIGDSAFGNCDSLLNIHAPLLTSISNSCFSSCNYLRSVQFPIVTSIGSSSFNDCLNLKNVEFGALTSVGSNAFLNCTLLVSFMIKYDASLSITASSLLSLDLSDLYVTNGDGTTGPATETKFTTAGMSKMNGYRLLY